MRTKVYDNRCPDKASSGISWSGIAAGVLIGLGLHVLLYGLVFCLGIGLFFGHGKFFHLLGLILLWLTFICMCLSFFIASFMAAYLGRSFYSNASPRILSFSYGITTWFLILVFNLVLILHGGYPFSITKPPLAHNRFYLQSSPLIFLHKVVSLGEQAESPLVSNEIKVKQLPTMITHHLRMGAIVSLSFFLFFSLQVLISWMGAYYAIYRVKRKPMRL